VPPPSPLTVYTPAPSGRFAGTGNVDLSGWLTRGWETIKDDLVTFAVGALIAVLLGGLTCGVLGPAMQCGLFMMCFRKMLYGRVEINDVMGWTRRAGPAILLWAIMLVPGIVIYAIANGPGFVVAAAAPDDETASMLCSLWSVGVNAVLQTLLGGVIFFVVPHIAARNVQPMEAIRASWEIFRRNWFMFVLVAFVYGLIAGLGLLACCIGILVTAPLVAAATAHAYADHFGLTGVTLD